MKILFVSGNLCDGGAQRVISVISSKLADMGHDVSLLLYSRNEKEYDISPKVKISAIGQNFAEYSRTSLLHRVLYIRKYLKRLSPDVAVGFMEGGYGLYVSALGLRFPKVASARIDPKILFELKGLRARLDMHWFSKANAVVLQTTRQMQHAENCSWKNQIVIANPVTDRALSFPEHTYDRPCRKIVMAGRLVPQKNYPMIFAAMQKVIEVYPDAVLDIFGKGSMQQSLEKMIIELKLEKHVFLKGWTQDTLAEYQNSDIYVLCSNYEGMPNALMEAMAVGMPCISTDCDTGPEDLIDDGTNGFLVPINDVECLAQRIIDIMGMTNVERKDIGENARSTIVRYFSSDVIAGKWEELLSSLMVKH